MDVDLYEKPDEPQADAAPRVEVCNVLRVETSIVANDEQEYRIILLDAEDTFDVVVEYPNKEREGVFSIVTSRVPPLTDEELDEAGDIDL